MLNDETKIKPSLPSFSKETKQEISLALQERLHEQALTFSEFGKQNLYNRLQSQFNYGSRSKQNLEDIGYADEFALFIVLLAQAVYDEFSIRICIREKSLQEVIILLLDQVFQIKPEIKANKSSATFLIRRSKEKTRITNMLKNYFNFEPKTGNFKFYSKNLEINEKRSILQGLFLCSASLADPKQTYQLEFICQNPCIYDLLKEILVDLKFINPNVKKPRRPSAKGKTEQQKQLRKKHKLVIRSGDKIGELLLFIGAQKKLLDFENVRVERQVRGEVNRVVNCDNYNLSKTVNTAFSQVQMLQSLKNSSLWAKLPEDLQEVANLRLANPECSLRELANLIAPKFSRNSLYYRLCKLQKIASILHNSEEEKQEDGM